MLLSKPANPEQIRIAQQLERHGGVLVQGPPGTGKTHTIGNLIGHLLAQGKSVLVTSHTTKALRMVRHHIVPGLRPLCVSVLESDLDSRRQLESAVAAIAERLGSAEAGSLEHEARKLEVERRDLLQKLDVVLQQLAEARANEYRELVVSDKAWAPAEAARKVMQDQPAHGWIPGPVVAEMSLPLSREECPVICPSLGCFRNRKNSRPWFEKEAGFAWRTWISVPISGNRDLCWDRNSR